MWEQVRGLNQYIDQEKPWKLAKTQDAKIKPILAHCIDQIQEIAGLLEPFLPETAEKIEEQFKGPEITSAKPLFQRI